MAIRLSEVRPGLHVFYQQPHLGTPEYGVIVRTNEYECFNRDKAMAFVRFNFDVTAKACHPRDLFWPPDYCAQDRVNPDGQPFSRPEEMPNA